MCAIRDLVTRPSMEYSFLMRLGIPNPSFDSSCCLGLYERICPSDLFPPLMRIKYASNTSTRVRGKNITQGQYPQWWSFLVRNAGSDQGCRHRLMPARHR
jgi:hypothetical protein